MTCCGCTRSEIRRSGRSPAAFNSVMVWLNRAFGGHFPIVPSLAIIVGVIGASIVLSLLFPKPPEETR